MSEYVVYIDFRAKVPVEVEAKDDDEAYEAAGEELARLKGEWLDTEAPIDDPNDEISTSPIVDGKCTATVAFDDTYEYQVDAANEGEAKEKALAEFKNSDIFKHVARYDVVFVDASENVYGPVGEE